MSRSLQHISIVSVATVASRFLGLARDIFITAVFGASALASAFVTAFTLPNLFRRLLGEGALTAALVPTLNDELATGQKTAAFILVNQVASWLGLITLLIVTAAMTGLQVLAESTWLREVSGSVDQWERWRLAAQLAVVVFPYLVFICLAAALSAALQTLDRYTAPALAPIWLNLAMMGALGFAVWGLELPGGEARMRWLCGGVLVGGFFQLVVPAIDLMRAGWSPRVDLRLSGAVKSILVLMGPTVLGSAIYLINLAVSRMIGLSLSDSAAAILNLATRLVELPFGVFAVAVTTVVFPLISRHAAKGDWSQMATAYRKGMRLILAVNVPAAVGLAVLAAPVIRVLFERGQFRPEDTAEMVPVLGVLAMGLPFFAYVSLLLRAFYAEKDTRTPVKAALVSFGVNLSLCLALMGPLGTVGLALAGTLAVVIQALLLQRWLSRHRASLALTPLLPDVGKIVLASAVMGAVVWLGQFALSGLGYHWGHDLLRLVGLIPVGVGVFAAMTHVLKLEGQADLMRILRDRLMRPRASREDS